MNVVENGERVVELLSARAEARHFALRVQPQPEQAQTLTVQPASRSRILLAAARRSPPTS